MGWIVSLIVLFIIAVIADLLTKSLKITISESTIKGSIIPIYLLLCGTYYCIKWHYEEENKKKKEDEEKKKKQEEIKQEILLKEKREEEEQERIRKKREQRIGALVANSQLISQYLPEKTNLAQNAINDAEREYQDGAFAPFWDAVERAVTNLARFNEDVKQITQNCSAYQTESQQLDSPPQGFDWKGAADSTDAITIADRLQKIVRNGQKNFQFAVIYEQRKTNQILVSGFKGLGQALSEIAYRIDESAAALSVAISDLSFTVSDTSEKAIEAGRENTQAIVKSAQMIKEQAEAEAETRRENERVKLEMLDNIQRGKKPSFPEHQGTLR